MKTEAVEISFAIITLGCDKNKVDSEIIAASMTEAGFTQIEQPEKAQIVIINTCSFIQPAIIETLDTLFAAIGYKDEKSGYPIVAACGCFVDRYGSEFITNQIPELDLSFSIQNGSKAGMILSSYLSSRNLPQPTIQEYANLPSSYLQLSEATMIKRGVAFIRISDGCNKSCSFCTIPSFKGKHRSVPSEKILQICSTKARLGIKELNLVAQDLLPYGSDLQPPQSLTGLLGRLNTIPEVEWIRLLYLYPDFVDMEILEFIAANPKMVKYLDIPMQHIHPKILRAMNRPGNPEKYIRLIENIRRTVPDVAIRSSFILGYPGEGDDEFTELKHFIQEIKLNHIGIFLYADEEKTKAFAQKSKVDSQTVEERRDKIMMVQQEISQNHLARLVGRTIPVLIEEEINGEYVGRTQWDAPEVDGQTFVLSNEPLQKGRIYSVEITESLDYDLLAEYRSY